MLHLLSRSIRLFICASIVATIAATASAQFKASIAGTVKDASGALVSGVTVTVTSSETGRSQQTVTGDEGFFRVSELPPGRYTITAEASGFKKQVLENIIIHAEESQGVNITLEAGQVNESVTVSAGTNEAAQIQTENANVDRAITNREILRIPQVGRDPYELTAREAGPGKRSIFQTRRGRAARTLRSFRSRTRFLFRRMVRESRPTTFRSMA